MPTDHEAEYHHKQIREIIGASGTESSGPRRRGRLTMAEWTRTGKTKRVKAYHGGGYVELPWMKHSACGRVVVAPRVFKHRCPKEAK